MCTVDRHIPASEVAILVVGVGFGSILLHSVVVNNSLGGFTALLVTVATCTWIVVLAVTSGSRMLFAKVFPSVLTSVLPLSG